VVDNKIAWDVKYTPSQVRQAVGLPQETLRHWRAIFSFLQDVRGQGPTYRAAQILALAVVKGLVRDCGVSVGALKPVEAALYGALSGAHWSALERSALCVSVATGDVTTAEGRSVPIGDHPLLVLPLGGVIASLRRELTGLEVLDPQQSFSFPPHKVGAQSTGKARP